MTGSMTGVLQALLSLLVLALPAARAHGEGARRPLDRADLLFGQQRYREALDEYARRPAASETRRKMGLCHMKLGNPKEAEGHLRAAVAEDPTDLEAKIALAEALTSNLRLTEALRLYRAILAHSPPEIARVRVGYARALQWTTRYVEAAAEYRAAADDPGTAFEARLGLAEVAAWQRRFDEACAEYRRAAERASTREERSRALGGLARALSWKGLLGEAVAGYRASLKQDDRNLPSLLGLAETLEWQRDFAEARRMYRRALEVQPTNKTARARLASLSWVKE